MHYPGVLECVHTRSQQVGMASRLLQLAMESFTAIDSWHPDLVSTLYSRSVAAVTLFRCLTGLISQVIYPALDAKVKNVTLAYSVEHEDEVLALG